MLLLLKGWMADLFYSIVLVEIVKGFGQWRLWCDFVRYKDV